MSTTLITLLGLGALLSPVLRTPTRCAARVAPPVLQELEPEWLDTLLDTSKGAATAAAGTSKRRKRTDAEPRAPRAKPAKIAKQRCACYGCGADLQTAAPSVAGYVEPDRYEEKAAHRQLKLLLDAEPRFPDALVFDLDLGTGKPDGVAAVALLRAEWELPVPALIVTGRIAALATVPLPDRCALLGKPVALATLVGALRRVAPQAAANQ